MGAPVLTTADVIMCPHGGAVSLSSSQSKVMAAGATVLRPSDSFSISGCAFSTPATGPHPCVSVKWMSPSQSTTAVSGNLLTQSSVGLCLAGDQTPQGTVLIQQTQMKVSAQ